MQLDGVAVPFGANAGLQMDHIACADNGVELAGAFSVVANFELAIGGSDADGLAFTRLQRETAEIGGSSAARRARNCHGQTKDKETATSYHLGMSRVRCDGWPR